MPDSPSLRARGTRSRIASAGEVSPAAKFTIRSLSARCSLLAAPMLKLPFTTSVRVAPSPLAATDAPFVRRSPPRVTRGAAGAIDTTPADALAKTPGASPPGHRGRAGGDDQRRVAAGVGGDRRGSGDGKLLRRTVPRRRAAAGKPRRQRLALPGVVDRPYGRAR